MAAQRIAGVAYLKYNSKQLPLRGNFTVSPSLYEKAMLAGQDYVHGYSEVPRVPFIEGDVSLLPEIKMRDIAALGDNNTNVVITAELSNGKVYTLSEAICTAAFELNTKDGLSRIRFEGRYCAEFEDNANTITEVQEGTGTLAGTGGIRA